MSEHKTFFGKIFGWIGDIFTKAAKEIWNSLSTEEQEALKSGSGIINVINEHLDETPAVIKENILKEFPNVDLKSLFDLAKELNLPLAGNEIEDAIAAAQVWLKSKEGTKWENAASVAAQTLALIL